MPTSGRRPKGRRGGIQIAHRRKAESHKGAFKPMPKGQEESHLPALQEMWAEIQRLRADVARLDASRLAPKFVGIDLDGVAAASGYYECGFEPYVIWAFGNHAVGTVLTFTTGMAVRDESFDGEVFQAMTAIRRSGGGEWRGSAQTGFCGLFSDDNSNFDAYIQLVSFDKNGFSWAMPNGGVLPICRGFAIGR